MNIFLILDFGRLANMRAIVSPSPNSLLTQIETIQWACTERYVQKHFTADQIQCAENLSFSGLQYLAAVFFLFTRLYIAWNLSSPTLQLKESQ